MSQTKPNAVPSQSERFVEAIAAVERALADGDDAKTREAIREAGQVAYNLAPQIVFALAVSSDRRSS